MLPASGESDDVQDHAAVNLLLDASRLLLRDGAAPFRSLGHLSVRPRPYQFVPLLMALRLDTVRLLIAAADEPTYRESGRAIHNLGWAYYNQGRFEEARGAYNRVLDVTPLFCPSIHNLGLVNEAEGKLDEAESLFLRARKCNKSDLNTWMALGKLYLRLDNLEQAEFHLDFVESHDPNGPLGEEARQLLEELGG